MAPDSVLWFTRKEREVLVLICDFRSYKQIAGALGISVPGVNYHVRNLLEKLSLADSKDLMKWGLQHPAALQTGKTRDVAMHRPGCQCEAPYCRTMLEIELPAAA